MWNLGIFGHFTIAAWVFSTMCGSINRTRTLVLQERLRARCNPRGILRQTILLHRTIILSVKTIVAHGFGVFQVGLYSMYSCTLAARISLQKHLLQSSNISNSPFRINIYLIPRWNRGNTPFHFMLSSFLPFHSLQLIPHFLYSANYLPVPHSVCCVIETGSRRYSMADIRDVLIPRGKSY